MTVEAIARLFLFVREAQAQNTGQRVEAIQRWSGGEAGQSWCAFFATMVLDIAYQGAAPIPRTGSCDDILHLAQKKGWLRERPAVGDLYLYLNNPQDAHHVGIVTDVDAAGFLGLSGNTSPDGLSSNGDRVAERHLVLKPGHTVFVHYQSEK